MIFPGRNIWFKIDNGQCEEKYRLGTGTRFALKCTVHGHFGVQIGVSHVLSKSADKKNRAMSCST